MTHIFNIIHLHAKWGHINYRVRTASKGFGFSGCYLKCYLFP